jgi:hypothetical protein
VRHKNQGIIRFTYSPQPFAEAIEGALEKS